jgi:tetratricopeptide (TPR) repeat protein
VSRLLRRLAATASAALLATFCLGCTPRTITRSAGGVAYDGRYIPAKAYEAYARGVVAERDGDLAAARRAYEDATKLDPDGAEPLVRSGATACAAGDVAAGLETLTRALDLSPSSSSAHRERALCQLRAKELDLALVEAELSLVLAPSDDAAVMLLVQVLEARGTNDRATALLLARCLMHPRSADVCRALEQRAVERGDLATAAIARRGSLPPSERPKRETLDAVDRALADGDLALARRRALRAGLSQGEVALRALLLGRNNLALEQAKLVAEADPDDTSSRVAWLVASNGRDAALAALPPPRGPRSPLAEIALYVWLHASLGSAAVGSPPLAPPEDPLAARALARLHH